MYDILDVIKNIQDLYENSSNLSVLKDFERVLDEANLYVYENWEDGELAYGPIVDRHWITAAFMWPKDKMPSPIGGKRLVGLGCKVKYEKSYIVDVRPIRTPDDIRPGTKKGKLDKKPIWVVEIVMPKRLAFDMYKGYINKMRNDLEKSTSKPTEAAMPTGAAVPAPPGGLAAPGMPTGGVPAVGAPPTTSLGSQPTM